MPRLASRSRLLAALALCTAVPAALTACAGGPPVHFGGVMNPADRPADARTCQDASRDLVAEHQPTPRFSQDLARYLLINQNTDEGSVGMVFDINAQGRTENIRYARDPADLERGHVRDAVASASRTISRWRFAWADGATRRYATDCQYDIDYHLVRRSPSRQSNQLSDG